MLTLTPSAKAQFKTILKDKNAIRIGIKRKGCSGFAYTMTYADQKEPFDEIVEADDVVLYIDPKAVMFILGTEIDYVSNEIESAFVFRNPNEKGRCGCGKSFHV